ncbi:MAG: hypothetical protein ABSC94_09530 [Polyangiaceae bacterium]|jgi:hypothetical protein
MPQLLDVLAIALVIGAGGAFALGASALDVADDFRSLYWLAVGTVALWASVRIARPAAKG